MKQWEQRHRGSGSAVLSLATTKRASDTLAIAATTGGTLISQDGGRTWDLLEGAFGTLPSMAVAVSPAYPSDHLVFLGARDGIVYSRNLRDWTLSRLPRAEISVTSIAPSPGFDDDGVILTATAEDGVLRSGDRGANFSAWSFGLLDLEVTSLALSPEFASDSTALAATTTGIYRTTTGGRAWRETSLSATEAPILSVAFAEDLVGCRAAATSEGGEIYVSDDMGNSWRRLPTPLNGLTLNAILLPSVAPLTMVIGHQAGIHISRDGGATWDGWDLPESVLCLAVALEEINNGFVLLAGSAEGSIYRCDLS